MEKSTSETQGRNVYGLISITKTCLNNFDPLKHYFYIVKLEFAGVYIIDLISAQNIDCGYSLEPPLCFEQKYEEYQKFYLKKFIFRW